MAIGALITRRYLRDQPPFSFNWWGHTWPIGICALGDILASPCLIGD
jgi:hypothetical protein